jgi:hypothetical protein
MKIKELLEGRHGYDDSGMSLSPGNDEGPDSWDYSAAHDRIGAGDPRPYRNRQYQVDVPHDVHINGKKWKTFGSHSHASNVAKKIKGATVHRSLEESASAGATSAANIGTVVNPQLSPGKARGKKSYTGSMATGSGTKAPPQPKVVQPKKADGTAVNALDMPGKKGNLFGSQAESMSAIKRR